MKLTSETEVLLLPDGRILVHNLTPAMAAVLAEIAPGDAAMEARAGIKRQKADALSSVIDLPCPAR